MVFVFVWEGVGWSDVWGWAEFCWEKFLFVDFGGGSGRGVAWDEKNFGLMVLLGTNFSQKKIMAGPPPPHLSPIRNKGLIAGLIEGNQWCS